MPAASVVASAVERLQTAAQDAAMSSSRSAVAFSEQAQQTLVPRAAGVLLPIPSNNYSCTSDLITVLNGISLLPASLAYVYTSSMR
ncbi:unnamed protein product [Miscanthus lutarioriparius]|nr:unnamed protein product [Miscanthus lutarioriparius]